MSCQFTGCMFCNFKVHIASEFALSNMGDLYISRAGRCLKRWSEEDGKDGGNEPVPEGHYDGDEHEPQDLNALHMSDTQAMTPTLQPQFEVARGLMSLINDVNMIGLLLGAHGKRFLDIKRPSSPTPASLSQEQQHEEPCQYQDVALVQKHTTKSDKRSVERSGEVAQQKLPHRGKARNDQKRSGRRPSLAVRQERPRRGKAGGGAENQARKRLRKLHERNKERQVPMQVDGFSMANSTNPVSTGWHGRQVPKGVVLQAWKDGSILALVDDMKLVPYTYDVGYLFFSLFSLSCSYITMCDISGQPQAVAFFDSDGLKFAYRTFQAMALQSRAEELTEAISALLGDHLVDDELRNAQRDNVRGPHLSCIMGYHKPYDVV
jgi:hypothetical protein